MECYQSNTTVIGLCESPLQLLNVIEFSLRYDCKGIVLIRLNGNKTNEIQFEEVLKYNKSLTPIYFSLGRKEYNPVKYLGLIVKHIRKLRRVDSLILGDIRAPWIKLFSWASGKKKVSIVDDGAYTLFLGQTPESFFDVFWYRRISDATLFTSFAVGKTKFKVVENAYTEVKKNLFRNSKDFKNRKLFVGSAYSETNVVSLGYEMRSIEKALLHLGSDAGGITYISHRRDAPEKVEAIRKNFPDIDVLQLTEPIELFLLKTCGKLQVLSGFYSSALYNIPRFVECENLLCFRFSQTAISSALRERVNIAYNNLVNSCHFQVVEL